MIQEFKEGMENKMLRSILLVIMLFLPKLSYGDYFDGIKCSQDISTIKYLELEYIDRSMTMKWYKIDNTRAKFGNVESDIISYIFWDNKFYGKECSIIGKDAINMVLRFFKEQVEASYEDKPELQVFAHPIQRKDGSWVFLKADEVIIIRRFSVHLGQVQILCRKLWENITGLSDLHNQRK
jgi:hypothetical protein